MPNNILTTSYPTAKKNEPVWIFWNKDKSIFSSLQMLKHWQSAIYKQKQESKSSECQLLYNKLHVKYKQARKNWEVTKICCITYY